MYHFEDNQSQSPDSPVLLAFGTDANNNEEHGLEQTHSMFKHLGTKSPPAKTRFSAAKILLTSGQYSAAVQKQRRGQQSQDVALLRQRKEKAGHREKEIEVRRDVQTSRQRRGQESAPDRNIAPANSSFTNACRIPRSPSISIKWLTSYSNEVDTQ